MSICKICGSDQLTHTADDKRMHCDTFECRECGVLCPATPWRESDRLLESHKRNTILTVELNELCQQHDIGKIGESVLPALKHYIEQSREFYQATERLLINEIGDFFSAHGGMLTVPQAHQELVTRVQRVFTLVKLQAQHKPLERVCEGIADGFGTRATCKNCAHFKPELAEKYTAKLDPNICRWRVGTAYFIQFKAKEDGL